MWYGPRWIFINAIWGNYLFFTVQPVGMPLSPLPQPVIVAALVKVFSPVTLLLLLNCLLRRWRGNATTRCSVSVYNWVQSLAWLLDRPPSLVISTKRSAWRDLMKCALRRKRQSRRDVSTTLDMTREEKVHFWLTGEGGFSWKWAKNVVSLQLQWGDCCKIGKT